MNRYLSSLLAWFKKSPKGGQSQSRKRQARLGLECLEGRELMSASPLAATVKAPAAPTFTAPAVSARQISLRWNAVAAGLFLILIGWAGQDTSSAVPELKGLSAADARAALVAAGLMPKFQLGDPAPSKEEALTVYAQRPAAGQLIARGGPVEVTLYAKFQDAVAGPEPGQPTIRKAPEPGKDAVPNLLGRSAAEARRTLADAGLVAKFQVGSAPASPKLALVVYAQDPAPGASAKAGSLVQLTVYAPSGTEPASSAGPTEPALTRVLAAPVLHPVEEVIDPRSGELSLTATDLVVQAGQVRLEVRRSLLTHTGPAGLLGSRWQLNWERRAVQSGKTAAIIDLAQARSFELDKVGKGFRSASGDSLVFTADQAVWSTPDGVTETFDAAGRLLERTERNGQKIVLRYDAAGRLRRVEGPFRTFLQFVTNGAGRLTRVESSTGATVQYFYGNNNAGAEPDTDAQAVGYTYDSSGTLVQISHPRFGETRFAHDTRGRVKSRRWADGAEERYEYDDTTHTRRHIDPAGAATTTRTSPDGRRIEMIDPLQRKSVIESDATGRPLVITGPTGLQGRFTYDALGRPVSAENPATGTTRFEYLGDTRLPTVLDAPDGKLSFTYDSRKNLLAVTSDKDKATSAEFEYSPDGLLKSVKTGDGQQSTYTYDEAGRRDSLTDAAGNKWRFAYDAHGRLVRTTDPRGGITARSYDSQGRLTQLTDAAGATTPVGVQAAGSSIRGGRC